MLKKSAIKKIIISTLALIVFSVLYLFPDSYQKNDIIRKTEYYDVSKDTLYIPNKDDYVSRISYVSKEKDIIKKAKEIISYLTVQDIYSDYIPNFFKAIIPKNTKVLDISLEDNLLKINFSKELLNINLKDERKLIESITYSLTEIDGIDKIMVFIDGKHLDKLPNSNEKLPLTLDRSIGINVLYDMDNYKDTTMITTYYVAKDNDYYYYIPISKITNTNKEKIEVIISELKSTPIYQTNLMSFLNSNAELLDYKILEQEISLSFNNYVLDDVTNSKITEEVKYSIGLSIKDTYNINKLIFNVNNISEELAIK